MLQVQTTNLKQAKAQEGFHQLAPDQTGTSTDETFCVDGVTLKMSVDATDAQIEKNDKAFVTVHVNNNVVEMKVDTGPKYNVLSKMIFTQVKNNEQIWPCFKSTYLVAYGGSKIKTVGMVRLHCHPEGEVYTLSFYTVEENVSPLLGLQACRQMGLVSFSEAVHQLSPTNDDLSDEIPKRIQRFLLQ